MFKEVTNKTLRVAGAAVLALWASACGSDVLNHPVEDVGGIPTTGGDGPRAGGNFPQPAIDECGPLPEGIDPIAGLASAWAVRGPMGIDGEGDQIPAGSIRLRFGDFGFGCDEPLFGSMELGCINATAWSFNLAPGNQSPGNYNLGALEHLNGEIFQLIGGGDATCGGEVGGGGSSSPNGLGGELVLHRVTADCVVGEFIDANAQIPIPGGDINGSFIAMRCDTSCVPHAGNGCF